MAELSEFLGGGGVKSLQRIAVTGVGNLTIAPVNINKTTINIVSCLVVATGDGDSSSLRSLEVTNFVRLINGTTISYSAQSPYASGAYLKIHNATIYAEVIEYA
ncbi:hypothetical protein F0249_03460 [Vibrio sp. 03-59-1]|uniref:hypothetical protein n=1 Tax=Vibrio sp. 03-59-1 TaxID=2607607 RepID=UPI0014933D32|nr:hypothetical protein [Vibrio sp. 03-59-1]NOH82856.1 hypothetical protein [Vibrio sp. 03-59-1]